MKDLIRHFYQMPLDRLFKEEKFQAYKCWRESPETITLYQQAALFKQISQVMLAPYKAAIERSIDSILQRAGDLKENEKALIWFEEDLTYLFISSLLSGEMEKRVPLIASLKERYQVFHLSYQGEELFKRS